MNALTVARKEITDVRRSYLIWALLGIFGVFTFSQLIQLSAQTFQQSGLERSTTLFVTVGTNLVVPYIAILAGGLAIVGEEETGSLRITLGYPVTRFGFVAGKALGRAVVLVGVIALGVTIGTLGMLVVVGTTSLSGLLQAIGFTSLYGLAYFGIAIGFSTIASTRLRSLALSFGVYLFFSSYWRRIFMDPLFRWIEGTAPAEGTFNSLTRSSLHWYLQVNRLNPEGAYDALVALSEHTNWFAIGVLLSWAVVPILLGSIAFGRRDVSRGET